jgi:hypothetical protein
MPTYRKPEPKAADPYKVQPLPTDRPIAVYYRQSSEGQVGNISTTMQTVDMVEHLIRQGWNRDAVLMIDSDAGVSGTKKIRERKGMSEVFDLILEKKVGVVAAQDVDRFFRDMAQIETNIFIEACRQNNVLVLTPNFVYDFAHPAHGRYHIQIFREQVQRAADYLEYFVKGRLGGARRHLNQQGQWTGTPIVLGYMIDNRRKVDDLPNPNFRKYVRYEPYCDMVLEYFNLYRQHNGNLQQTWQHIDQHGPYIPEFAAHPIPPGFFFHTKIRRRSRVSGKLILSMYGLKHVLTNAVYIGHWAHNGVIVQRHNHEAIIPLDLFMYAFNRLSQFTLDGEPNIEYARQRPWVRHDKTQRPVPPPTYTGMVFSQDAPGIPLRRLTTNWQPKNKSYAYALHGKDSKRLWYMMAPFIDGQIDALLLERLRATTIDEQAWRDAVNSSQKHTQSDHRRVTSAIRHLEDAQRGIVENLKVITHPDLVRQLQEDYVRNEGELARLGAELHHIREDKGQRRLMLEARPVLETVVTRWSEVARDDRRELFEAFAERVIVNRPDMVNRTVTVVWRDGTQTTRTTQRQARYRTAWTKAEYARLRELVEGGADQIDLLRAFPQANWRTLRELFIYHFGIDAWQAAFKRKKSKYGQRTRWEHTEEYRTLHESTERDASEASSAPITTGAPDRSSGNATSGNGTYP